MPFAATPCASTARITSPLAMPASSASVQAASTAPTPWSNTAPSTLTNCWSPSACCFSFLRNWATPDGRSQSLNGAPLPRALGLHQNRQVSDALLPGMHRYHRLLCVGISSIIDMMVNVDLCVDQGSGTACPANLHYDACASGRLCLLRQPEQMDLSEILNIMAGLMLKGLSEDNCVDWCGDRSGRTDCIIPVAVELVRGDVEMRGRDTNVRGGRPDGRGTCDRGGPPARGARSGSVREAPSADMSAGRYRPPSLGNPRRHSPPGDAADATSCSLSGTTS